MHELIKEVDLHVKLIEGSEWRVNVFEMEATNGTGEENSTNCRQNQPILTTTHVGLKTEKSIHAHPCILLI
ncbi:hypothetical protein L2E82_46737 [Cichorium intybus]|uniref:Uncharacterized protein n=1 Tax=Cichorium intybus TaxID=13427 RepID=A0ACB8YT06_CICIN|nr:hypothetical protein L2E82_46737 [Cichorium intybus]